MKVLYIGDTHGKHEWDWILIHVLEFDKIVFLGDYVDSFTHHPRQILDNLIKIIGFKLKYPDKVELLLGNHDYAYIFSKSTTSGFRPEMYFDIKQLFETNWSLFNLAWGYEGKDAYTLATHAGLTTTFLVNYVNKSFVTKGSILNRVYTEDEYVKAPLHEILNYLKDNMDILWVVGPVRHGAHETGSIVWANKSEIIEDAFPMIDQVVGHTASNFLEVVKNEGDTVYFIDKRGSEGFFPLLLTL